MATVFTGCSPSYSHPQTSAVRPPFNNPKLASRLPIILPNHHFAGPLQLRAEPYLQISLADSAPGAVILNRNERNRSGTARSLYCAARRRCLRRDRRSPPGPCLFRGASPGRLKQLAEEVVQSTFIKLARHAHRLTSGTILSAWLYQVTRREAIDVVRREARRQLREAAMK